MTSSEPYQQGNFGYLINSHGKPTSRLVRTKDINQDSTLSSKPSEQVIPKPTLLVRKGRNQKAQSKIENIAPSRLSELSSSAVFQGIDSPTKSISKKSIEQQPRQTLANKGKEVSSKKISLVGTTIMGTNTKHRQLQIEKIQTPTKNKQTQQNTTPKNSQNRNLTPQGKFSRKRQVQPNKLDKNHELTLNINDEKNVEKEASEIIDKSANQNNTRIQRKSERNKRQIKFKKQENKVESQMITQQPLERKNIENQKSDSKTLASQQKCNNFNKSQPLIRKQKQAAQQFLSQQISASKRESISIISKSIVKRSTIIGFVIKKMLFARIVNTFNTLKYANYQLKTKATKQSLLMSQSILIVSKNKQKGLIRWSFDILKAKFCLSYISELKNILIYKPINRTHISLSIMQKIYQSKLRKIWKKIKNKHLWSINQVRSLKLFDRFSIMKISQVNRYFLQSMAIRVKTKLSLLNNLNTIFNNFNKNKVRIAFFKISSFLRPWSISFSVQRKISKSFVKQSIPLQQQQNVNKLVQTNPAFQQKAQKLKAKLSQFKDNLTLLSKKLEQIRTRSSEQKSQLQQKISSLKQSNQQIQSQLSYKKGKIQIIQRQLNNIITSKTQNKITKEQIQIQDEKLTKLSKVYMGTLKSTNILVIPGQIFEEYQLNVDYCTQSYQQWQLLACNIDLKRHISAYQSSTQDQFKARKVALCQQQVVTKLLGNYIRQQYIWQWLHITAQSIQLE